MEFLPQANRVALGEEVEDQIVATDKDVVIIGGGDTGADCLGTSIRQRRARSRSWRSCRSRPRTVPAHSRGRPTR